MKKKHNTDHVRAHDGSQGFWGFSCAHCGAKQAMPSPCNIDVYIAGGKAFEKSHAACDAAAETARAAEIARHNRRVAKLRRQYPQHAEHFRMR